MDTSHSNYIINQGTVFKKLIGNYIVHSDNRIVTCSISPRLRKELLYPIADPNSLPHIVQSVKNIQMIDPVAVGDRVSYLDTQDGCGLIVEVLPRKSKLSRRSAVPHPGGHALEQLIVANVDQVVPVLAVAQPAPSWNLLDRYLASAESLNLPSLICITKVDLGKKNTELAEEIEAYRRIGYPTIFTSVVTGEGLQDFKDALSGKVTVFIGKSGVGKTSLLNAIQPGLGLRVNEVNRVTGKGKHTTSHLEMVPLNMGDGSGGAVVDTPGMREFGLWDVDRHDIAYFFPELRLLVGKCKFGLDCSHDHEPGCAIRKAVAEDKINQRRYLSYLKMASEVPVP